MIFEPLSSWLVALLANGTILADEKAKNDNAQRIIQQRQANEIKPNHPEPHRDPASGKIIIENSKLYNEDVKKYGAYQAQQWVQQGKYNLSPEELQKEHLRIEKHHLELYGIGGTLSENQQKRIDEINHILNGTQPSSMRKNVGSSITHEQKKTTKNSTIENSEVAPEQTLHQSGPSIVHKATYSTPQQLSQKKNRIYNESLRQLLRKDEISDYAAFYERIIEKRNEFTNKMRSEGYSFVLEEDNRRNISQLEEKASQQKNIYNKRHQQSYHYTNRRFNEALRDALRKKNITDFNAHYAYILRRQHEFEQKMRNEGHTFVIEEDVKVLLHKLQQKATHQNEKPWTYKDFILDGIDTNNDKEKRKMLSSIQHLCSDKLAEVGMEEVEAKISQNHVNVSAYRRNVYFDFDCKGQPNSIFCDGETFRNTLSLCAQAIGYITSSNAQLDLENYYYKHQFENISLSEQSNPNVDYAETIIHGTVEKNNIRLKIKLVFSPDLLTQSFGSPIEYKATQKKTQVDVDSMDGLQFEHFCAEILRKNNYDNVSVTQGSGDQGIDIIAYRDGVKYGIQCKCYASPIGNKAVQEVFAGKAFYQCHVGIVLTNNYFTPAAIELAQRSGIVL